MNPHCFFFPFSHADCHGKNRQSVAMCTHPITSNLLFLFLFFSFIFYAALSRVPVKYNATVHPASLFVRIKQRTHNMLISEC